MIVVLVILAILASLLIPALTGYVTKAKKQAVITEARDVWTASQAALTECYALYPESFNDKSKSCRFTITVNGVTYNNVGRITNGALHAIQKKPNDKTEAGSSSRRVAAQVLKYLESDGKNPRYTFGNGDLISSAVKPSAYFKSKPKKTDVIIQIFHTKEFVAAQAQGTGEGVDEHLVAQAPGKFGVDHARAPSLSYSSSMRRAAVFSS